MICFGCSGERADENITGQWAVKYLQCYELDQSTEPASVAIRLSICRGVSVFIN